MRDERQPQKTVRCEGQAALLWHCAPERGGCGARGAIVELEAVKHWARGGRGQVQCQCGAAVDIGKQEEQRRIITPHEAAKQRVAR